MKLETFKNFFSKDKDLFEDIFINKLLINTSLVFLSGKKQKILCALHCELETCIHYIIFYKAFLNKPSFFCYIDLLMEYYELLNQIENGTNL